MERGDAQKEMPRLLWRCPGLILFPVSLLLSKLELLPVASLGLVAQVLVRRRGRLVCGLEELHLE